MKKVVKKCERWTKEEAKEVSDMRLFVCTTYDSSAVLLVS